MSFSRILSPSVTQSSAGSSSSYSNSSSSVSSSRSTTPSSSSSSSRSTTPSSSSSSSRSGTPSSSSSSSRSGTPSSSSSSRSGTPSSSGSSTPSSSPFFPKKGEKWSEHRESRSSFKPDHELESIFGDPFDSRFFVEKSSEDSPSFFNSGFGGGAAKEEGIKIPTFEGGGIEKTAAAYIEAQIQGFADSGYTDLERLQALGVDTRNEASVARISKIFERIHQGNVTYSYEPKNQMILVNDESGRTIAYLKPGLMRGLHEASVCRISYDLKASEFFSPIAYIAFDGKNLKQIPVNKFLDLPYKGKVKRGDLILFSEPLLDGREAQIVANTTSGNFTNIKRSDQVGFEGRMVMVLSAAVEEVKPFDLISFNKVVIVASILGFRDMNPDAFIGSTCIDFEEIGAIGDKKGRRATLQLGPILTTPLAKEELTQDQKDHLIDWVNQWDYKQLQENLEKQTISHRHTDLESQTDKRSSLFTTEEGLEAYIDMGARDPAIYPTCSLESDQLFNPEQIQEMIARAKKISFALKRAKLSNSSYTSWTSFFAADPVSAHICSQVAHSRRAFLRTKRVESVGDSSSSSSSSSSKSPRSRSGSKILQNPSAMRLFAPDTPKGDEYLSRVAAGVGGELELEELDLSALSQRRVRSPNDSSPESLAAYFLGTATESESSDSL